MRRIVATAALALPVALGACAPEPEAPPAPVLSPAEEACGALALQAQGLAEGDVAATPVAATKTGATVYEVSLNGIGYSCTVEIDNTISGFEAI
jgi:hypothetical protein